MDLKTRVWIIVAIITGIIASGGVLISQVTTNVKATQAHEYAIENKYLPSKVKEIERRVCENEQVVKQFSLIQAEQRHIVDDMKRLQQALEKMVNGR